MSTTLGSLSQGIVRVQFVLCALFYSSTEVIKALIVCELRRSGFSPRQVQQVARNLQEHGIQLYELRPIYLQMATQFTMLSVMVK